jgi:hypothetical protein
VCADFVGADYGCLNLLEFPGDANYKQYYMPISAKKKKSAENNRGKNGNG